jgi:AcrR family transcriptional regulator
VTLSKSERTRKSILTAARKLFGEKGFDRTTIRDVAAAARIDPALVMRYFGTKDRLFAEAAEFRLNLPSLEGVEHDRIGEALVRHYLNVWEGEAGTGGLPILLRSAASSEAAAEQMREIFRRQVMPAVKAIKGGRGASQRAALVASQLLGMALCRYILRFPPMVSMPHETLVKEVGRTIQRYATGEDAAEG